MHDPHGTFWGALRFASLLVFLVIGADPDSASCWGVPPVTVTTEGLSLDLDQDGQIVGCKLGGKTSQPISGGVSLVGCSATGATTSKQLSNGGVEFTRRVENAQTRACLLSERFLPTQNSIRWEMEVVSDGGPWSAPLEFQLKYSSSPQTLFWTSWTHESSADDPTPEIQQGDLSPKIPDDEVWIDPLVPRPLANREWSLGNGKGSICIPMASLLEPANDTGLSLVVAPDQPLLCVVLSAHRDGTVTLRHHVVRLGEGRRVMFAVDLTAHEADWRGGLRWMVSRYPSFFNPPLAQVDTLAGTCSYSHYSGKLDAERLKKMAYRVNWDAAFDWPYYGLYLPPMPDCDTCWETSGHNSLGDRDPERVKLMSYRKMNDRARAWKENGFYSLAYFNCTEFGSQIKGPEAAKADLPEAELWRDANTLLYRKLSDGIFQGPEGNVFPSWSGSVVMDPGSASFRAFLVEQARRHAENLPDAAGIIIDRMDWLTAVNFAPGADDGIGWYQAGQPGRFLALGWIKALAEIGAVLHPKGKVIFANCCLYGHRLELVRDVDGFFDEYGDSGYSLNGSSLLGLRKPALMWTHDVKSLQPSPDAYFQRHLHMGAFPMAPFPGNDHSIEPDPTTEQWYLDYGPLLSALRGKKWVLEPHCVEVKDGLAKANLFEVPGGYAVPITYAGQAPSVEVILRGLPGKMKAEVLHPGAAEPIEVVMTGDSTMRRLTVPLSRGCAMIRICSGVEFSLPSEKP
ncbi:MAG: hypothetical protein ACYC6N_30560 [Pirellulaceae bacterium]